MWLWFWLAFGVASYFICRLCHLTCDFGDRIFTPLERKKWTNGHVLTFILLSLVFGPIAFFFSVIFLFATWFAIGLIWTLTHIFGDGCGERFKTWFFAWTKKESKL